MKHEAYPKHVYGEDGSLKIVNSEEEESALEGTWYQSPADVPKSREYQEAEKKQPEQPIHPVEDERMLMEELKPDHVHRDRLEAEARHVGLKFSKSWTNERLQREILEHASS